ncbi:MAG TPA: hypothetical protein VKB88_21415 [Bryobacteraceae bacterium]|nr:hypothetical protein [Bryobacteraceae bacterium]
MPAAVAAPLIGAGISGVGSILGGVKGAGAANNAANLQYQAAQKAIAGFQDQLGQVNPQITAAALKAAQDAIAAANTAGGNLTTAAQQAGQGVTTAAQGANAFLQPYMQTGQQATSQLANLMGQGFGMQQMQNLDPGYQFRIDMANKALQASAAARGGALGGGTASALQSQSQNLASAEMQNAFNRWITQQQQLESVAGQGLQAGGQAGTNLMNAAQLAGQWGTGAAQQAGGWLTQGTQYGGTAGMNAANTVASNVLATQKNIADLLTGGAAAQAGGVVGGANAFNQALSGFGNAAIGAGNAIGGYYNLQNLMRMFGKK